MLACGVAQSMSRDHRKLRVFQLADERVVEIYRASQCFPRHEIFGLRAQLRRAAVSVPANIVEGCARKSTSEYGQFLNIATGSAAETEYLVDLAFRLGMLQREAYTRLCPRYTQLVKGLKSLVNSYERCAQSPEPTARNPDC
jgi:four helix bundle protein